MGLQFAITTFPLTSDISRPLYDQVEETAEIIGLCAKLGTFDAVEAQHHWLTYPTKWIEPFPLLARLAPVAGQMRLMTGVVKPPLHNPVDLAHQVATLDHLCNGRFILGVGVGYPEAELVAVGATRKERGPRFEECVALMKALWSGEEVTFEGKYWSVHNVRMGYTPVQKPHPPIWNASYSVAACRRAARECDGVLIAPQATWSAVKALADEYRRALTELGKAHGVVAANRNVCVARSSEEAERQARAKVVDVASYYSPWGMQERTTVDMVLDPQRDPREWAVVGTPEQCVEQIGRYAEEAGIDFMGIIIANWPKEPAARIEHLQFISEEVLGKFH